jgi:predicted aspartyl protease
VIAGVVNSNLEVTVRLLIRGLGGQEQEIDAVIDTGFNGFLILPPALVRQLNQRRKSYVNPYWRVVSPSLRA